MSKIYRTAQGQQLDMAALRAKNEKVRAVGNMSVNARGDVIDSHNRVIHDATKRVSGMYQKTVQPSGAMPPPTERKQSLTGKNTDITSQELEDIDGNIPNPKK